MWTITLCADKSNFYLLCVFISVSNYAILTVVRFERFLDFCRVEMGFRQEKQIAGRYMEFRSFLIYKDSIALIE